jgi:uncharacterized metal-binding protein YceD (DUF177 family)
MDYLERFSIPIKGMSVGVHEYQFIVDKEFFKHFEDSQISDGDYSVKVQVDRKERIIILNFEISGEYVSKCDRCLAIIKVPSLLDYTVYLKSGSDKDSGVKEVDDVIYIYEEDFNFNLSPVIHQLIMLSMPWSNTYDCENDPNPKCDFKMLEYLEGEIEDEKSENEEFINPVWEKLKKDFNKN